MNINFNVKYTHVLFYDLHTSIKYLSLRIVTNHFTSEGRLDLVMFFEESSGTMPVRTIIDK